MNTAVVMKAGGIAERIKRLRTAADLSARELDKLAALAPGHTRRIETGKRLRLEADTIAQLATVFGASMEWLHTGVGDGPTDAQVRAALRRAEKRNAKRNGNAVHRAGSATRSKRARAGTKATAARAA